MNTKFLLTLTLLFMGYLDLHSQNYFLLTKESDASCVSYRLVDGGNAEIKLPASIKGALDCPSVLSLDRNILIGSAKGKIFWFDILRSKTVFLFKIPSYLDGISSPVWSPDGSKLMFVLVNQEMKNGYTEFCRILVLTLSAEGKVLSQQQFDRPVNYSCGSVCSSYPGEDFGFESDNSIRFKRHEAISDRPGEWENITLQ